MKYVDHTIFENDDIILTLDSNMLMEVETDPCSHGGDFFTLTQSTNGALDIASRIMYAVWLEHPELAETRVKMLADIPDVYKLMQRHKA